MSATIIGIDLGTKYSSVSVWKDGKVEIIRDENGNYTTANYVAFTDTERLLGNAAKNQSAINPSNTIFNIKRLTGRKFADENLQHDLQYFSYRIIDYCNQPKIQIKFKNELKELTTEEITSMILIKLINISENYLNKTIENVVISVPANFSNSQRQATKNAAKIAGLKNIRIINEPTATALTYIFNNNFKNERNLLIYDLGAGTFDVSIITVNQNLLFEVRATAGNTHLGGEDFNNRLMNYFIEEFYKKFQKNLQNNPRSIVRLNNEIEIIKRILSTNIEVSIIIDALYDGIDFQLEINREKFEELNSDLFEMTIELVNKALSEAEIDKYLIDDIILVGGSSRIPKIQQSLQSCFEGKSLNLSLIGCQSVAYGAAIQAASLNGLNDEKLNEILLIDITPLTLGVEINGGLMKNIIKNNTRIPCQQTQTFTTYVDNQPRVNIKVYEGEDKLTQNNNLLGKFELSGIPLKPRGIPKIDVTFDLDVDGILNVSAKDINKNNKCNIEIEHDNNVLSQKDIDHFIFEAEIYKEEDEKQKIKINACNQLENYIFQLKQLLRFYGDTLNATDQEIIKLECNTCLQWLDLNAFAEKDEYDKKLKHLYTICNPIIEKLDENNLMFRGDKPTIEEID